MISTGRVLDEVHQERIRQDEKWGEQNHGPALWLAILGEEYGESCKALFDTRESHLRYRDYWPSNPEELRTELIQTAAVAVAIIECIDRFFGRSPE